MSGETRCFNDLQVSLVDFVFKLFDQLRTSLFFCIPVRSPWLTISRTASFTANTRGPHLHW